MKHDFLGGLFGGAAAAKPFSFATTAAGGLSTAGSLFGATATTNAFGGGLFGAAAPTNSIAGSVFGAHLPCVYSNVFYMILFSDYHFSSFKCSWLPLYHCPKIVFHFLIILSFKSIKLNNVLV